MGGWSTQTCRVGLFDVLYRFRQRRSQQTTTSTLANMGDWKRNTEFEAKWSWYCSYSGSWLDVYTLRGRRQVGRYFMYHVSLLDVWLHPFPIIWFPPLSLSQLTISLIDRQFVLRYHTLMTISLLPFHPTAVYWLLGWCLGWIRTCLKFMQKAWFESCIGHTYDAIFTKWYG